MTKGVDMLQVTINGVIVTLDVKAAEELLDEVSEKLNNFYKSNISISTDTTDTE